MRLTKYYIPTLKEVPAEAEVVSHRLLLRAGMIRKLSAGIYSFLPMGLRALNKVARIVREEMDRSGALEIAMPMVQPADLWQETGRWEYYGRELLRLKDRHDREFCLGPTHEEVITDLLRGEIRSYRQLPLNLYQIQAKFRDEIRPRFGLMRGREFLMKDAYSFDRDEEGAQAAYQCMYDAYTRIFTRLGLRFRAVEADSGAIGGSYSHEFMVLADTGEDTIAACADCSYAANLEKAEVVVAASIESGVSGTLEVVSTPSTHTVEEVAALLKVPAARIIKTLIYLVDGTPVAALVRGDRALNDIKLKNALGGKEAVLADAKTVERVTGAPLGFAGPTGLTGVAIWADNELRGASGMVTGANQGDAHLVNVDLARDAAITAYADLRTVTEEDPCPRCGGRLTLPRGIEVGHVFKLGTKYSEAMRATFLDEQGKERFMVMGCYGIGVSRIVAAAIEQNHDEQGIIFPPSIAPFDLEIVALNMKDEAVRGAAESLYEELRSLGAEVLLDDREERPGVKFKDADLSGIPLRVVVGGKGLERGVYEVSIRRTGERTEVETSRGAQAVLDLLQAEQTAWGILG